MKYQYLKLIQIIIVSLIAIYEQNPIIYIGTLISSLLTHTYHIHSTSILIIMISLTFLQSIQIHNIIFLLCIIFIGILSSKASRRQHLSIKYVLPVFLITISLISINQNQLIRITHLVIFFAFLLLTYYCQQSKLKYPLYLLNIVWIAEGILLSIQYFSDFKRLENIQNQDFFKSQNQSWWYFMAYPLSLQCSCLILQAIHKMNSVKVTDNLSSQINIQVSTPKQIQMNDLSQRQQASQKMQQTFKNISLQPQFQQNLQSTYSIPSQPSQVSSQIGNLFLLIPFLVQNSGLLQIPLYIYFFSIHYNKSSSYLYLFMILTNFVIIFMFKSQEEWSLHKALILRVAIVLLVNKNIRVLSEATQIVKKIWLRSSFVLVLAVMFWFSLKTVNIFHLILTVVLLIFITADNQKNEISYRHRNWVYLLSFFNVFIFSRFVYNLLVKYGIYIQTVKSIKQNLLDLTGISFNYQSQARCFNLIPLTISIFVALQYLTYQSRIYNLARDRVFQPIYEQKINELIKLFTIVYYKLIPWLSYAVIYFVLLMLEFSCTSLLLIVWLNLCLATHIQNTNSLNTYRKMYYLWTFMEKLFAIQIILRYAFEFLNFPMLMSFFHSLPFFSTIDKYKEFLGLAIRQADYVYFKAISKFQLMVGLDFACIFICFLVIEYYTFLIVYHEMQNSDNLTNLSRIRFRQKQKIKQIYQQFIDFKLTIWLKSVNLVIKWISKIFLLVYYPLLGLYCCFRPSIVSFCYMLVCIRYYLIKNSQSYEKYIQKNLILMVKQLFKSWKQQKKQSSLYQNAKQIYLLIISGKKTIRLNQLITFQYLRKWILIISSLAIILNYLSRIFQVEETQQIFGQTNKQRLLGVRWYLYVAGVSIDSYINIVEHILIMVTTILEVKCTRFLIKLYDLTANKQTQFTKVANQPKITQQQNQLKSQNQLQNQIKSQNPQQNQLKSKNQRNQALLKQQQRMLYKSLLQKQQQPQRELIKQLEQNFSQLHQLDNDIQLQKNIQQLKQQVDEQDQRFTKKRIQSQLRRRKDSISYIGGQKHLNDFYQTQDSVFGKDTLSRKQLKKFIQMQVSLLQGTAKLVERFFVMVLVFLSIVENRHPFGIVYLVCSMALTFIGPYSILALSRTISILIITQYLLLLCNYNNSMLTNAPSFLSTFQSPSSFGFLSLSSQWSGYLTFGDTTNQFMMMMISWVILFMYQFYFYVLNGTWFRILHSLTAKMALTKIEKKIYDYFILIYTYSLIYSPLCITVCSLGIYLLDFTTTNLFLTCLSIVFLFKSVLVEEYQDSRHFWKLYFYILQFFIVIFMLIYDILSIPMYQKYCIQILCSSQEFHTKVNKAILLFVLQIGIDLMKSSYFITAMDILKVSLSKQASFSKLAIAYKQNDKKIIIKFHQLNKQQSLNKKIIQIQQFLQKYSSQPCIPFPPAQTSPPQPSSLLDSLIQILPSFVDSTLVLTSQQAEQFVRNQNVYWLIYKPMRKELLYDITEKYMDQFGELEGYQLIMDRIRHIRQLKNQYQHQYRHSKYIKSHLKDFYPNDSIDAAPLAMRKSFSQHKLPYEASDFYKLKMQEIRESVISIKSVQQKQQIESKQKQKLIFLLILESTISNWHYLTYIIIILQHLFNLGFLTLPFPILAFCYGLIHPYQAPKNIWRAYFLLILLPISFKFSLAIGLIPDLEEKWINLLIGDNKSSILIQYLVILFVLIQCLILKIIGLYQYGVTEVESMKLALIRNIINNDNELQISHLQLLLKDSLTIPQKTIQQIFCRSQQKPGYSYTTLMTSLQLLSLFYVFFFYDQMAIRQVLSISQMISYNQFTAGMVILTFIQLFFILCQRFINISNLKQYFPYYQVNLLIKYAVLFLNLVFIQFLVLFFFPYNSNHFTGNTYIQLFYVVNAMGFLCSALQIKYGIDQKSKGFMDVYTWYNGMVYMAFRAVPFLFEFKIFSDWTFTKTALRLFDWIKLEQIFGRMYIAKCNALFLQGKVLGSKIQWWKKFLMGVPLLFAIILLIFGPLILFSNLNPLASKNAISGGYLELCLKINKTNQYVFYTNSHITDITMFNANEKQQQILKLYDIQEENVQVINLQEYSDQYWEISEGSFLKLLEEPQASLYQIVIRVKFQRNQTGATPIYTVSTYQIPDNQKSNFKQTLLGLSSMPLPNFLNNFLRLDNNNGLHFLGDQKLSLNFRAAQAKRSSSKQYWIISNGLRIKIASDKYTKAIFGYSVMSFYISIILVIANYFRFLFQGSANTIILNDIPLADPVLDLCNGVYQARYYGNTELEERLFWLIVDLLRSPDQIKSLTGSYLQARIQTKRVQDQRLAKQQANNHTYDQPIQMQHRSNQHSKHD